MTCEASFAELVRRQGAADVADDSTLSAEATYSLVAHPASAQERA